MKIMTWTELFGPITGKVNPRLSLKKAEWRTLTEDTMFNGYTYAKGSQFKIFETSNFGYVVFHPDTKCPDGSIPGRKIHRY